jgi:hypothetical protein
MVADVIRRPPTKILIALAAIGVLAAALRLIGITFGLPAVYNPDEIAIMSRALAFAKGDLNPHNFLYPTFYFYVLFAWVGASFVVTWLLGIVPSLAAFQAQFFTDPTNIYLAGRLLGATCGVATVLLTYALGARLAGAGAGRAAGLAAALFLAVSPTNVRDSHYVKHDVPVTLTVVIAQLAILRLLADATAKAPSPKPSPQGRGLRFFRRGPAPEASIEASEASEVPGQRSGASDTGLDLTVGAEGDAPSENKIEALSLGERVWVRGPLLLAGAACGMAFSTHYYTIFLTLPLLLAIYFRHGGRWRAIVTDTITAGIAGTVVFFALSPFLLVEPGTAYQDILANRQIVVDRAVAAGHGAFASAPAYARMLWTEGFGGGILLAALIGVVLAFRDRGGDHWRPALVLIAFPIAFLVFISNTVAAGRYLNPALPAIAAFAAFAITRIPLRPELTALIGAAITATPFSLSLQLGLFFQQTDTRTLAQRIIERNVPPGATVLVQPYSVVLTQSRESLVEALQAHIGDPSQASTKFALRLKLDPYPSPAYRTLYLGDGGLDVDKIYLSYKDLSGPDALSTLRQAGVQYVVMKRYNVEDPAAVPLREQLKAQGRLITSVTPYRADADEAERAKVAPFLHNTDTPWHRALERPGPGIEVWQVP